MVLTYAQALHEVLNTLRNSLRLKTKQASPSINMGRTSSLPLRKGCALVEHP